MDIVLKGKGLYSHSIKQEKLSMLVSTGSLTQKGSCCRLCLTDPKTNTSAIVSLYFSVFNCPRNCWNLGVTCLFILSIVSCQLCSFHHEWWAHPCMWSTNFTSLWISLISGSCLGSMLHLNYPLCDTSLED